MASKGYQSPAVTEYGSVESITEQNKSSLGEDSDVQAINLEGSAPNL